EMESQGKLLIDYLKELTSSASKPISIAICGHSLGGALSPVLSLSLTDRRSEWDAEEKASLSVLPSAGFSPGNVEFATYYDHQLGTVTDRIWNELDLIPHVYQQSLLDQARTFYEPDIQPNVLTNKVIDFFELLKQDKEYHQICLQTSGFNLGYNEAIEHIVAENFVIPQLSNLIAKLILHYLGYENPPQWLINNVAKTIESLLKELIGDSTSGQTLSDKKISEAELEPHVKKIIAELQKDKPDSNSNKLRQNILQVLLNLPDFIRYVARIVCQHMFSYTKYLKVLPFHIMLLQKLNSPDKMLLEKLINSQDKESNMATQLDTQPGQSGYTPYGLFIYDFLVLGINNRFFWKCPTKKILELYNQNITPNHLDVGVGTGYFLDKCNFSSPPVRLGLMDLNMNSLQTTARRIARHNPEVYQHDVYQPMDNEIELFDSIGMNYLLHCLPGNMTSKAEVFKNLNKLLNSGGRIFGSTLLQGGVELGYWTKKFLDFYNAKKVFTNADDDLETLEKILRENYSEYSISVSGCAALFSAKKD
ncbi:MAG: methyltransferase, partial [Symploca sp. SIO1B1]|nr:methyltransferase [Symploca sp. SIO1B1]